LDTTATTTTTWIAGCLGDHYEAKHKNKCPLETIIRCVVPRVANLSAYEKDMDDHFDKGCGEHSMVRHEMETMRESVLLLEELEEVVIRENHQKEILTRWKS
jgi:hypothetical protein